MVSASTSDDNSPSGESVPLMNLKSQSGQTGVDSATAASTSTPPQSQRASPTDTAAVAAMMAQQQYGATSHSTAPPGTGYPDGGILPPTYDMNAMAAAWEQLHQQQQLSPVIYLTSSYQGGNSGQPQSPQQLSPSLQYPYMYPYAPHQGTGGHIPPPPHPHYFPPPYGYPMLQSNPQHQQQAQTYAPKPPRGNAIGSSNNSASSKNHQGGTDHVSTSQNAHAASSSGNLPSMTEIFPPTSGGIPGLGSTYVAPIVDCGGGDATVGYGSISAVTSPKVYNAPPVSSRRLPPSGRSAIPRVDSSSDLHKQRRGNASTFKKLFHRRIHSDSPLQNSGKERAESSDSLPPLTGARHNRARTLSGGNPFSPKPTHRRTLSASSMISSGDASQVSVRSNIAKSSLFAGIDPNTGRVLMQFPYEATRLVMIPEKTKKCLPPKMSSRIHYQTVPGNDEDDGDKKYADLTLGYLYAENPADIVKSYEEYAQTSEELERGDAPYWESLDANPRLPGGGSTKRDLLPPENYVLPVSDDIYKRMLAEVDAARNMPCGLFFCGHHEDVAHPSIWIAGALVILLFGTLLTLAFYTECSTFQCLTF